MTTTDIAARDRILDAHQRKALVRWLETVCADIYETTRAPVSVNDARGILMLAGVDIEDTRFLGGVFPRARWRGVGYTMSDSGRCHARQIRTFVPRLGAAIPVTERPAWVSEAW